MSAQHTPGPWVYTFNPGEYSESEILDDEGRLIAIGAGQNYGCWRVGDDNGDAEFEANARLIAAAPELYETLKQLLDGMAGEEDSDDGVLKRARAAIAKATGGAA
jgi:hypothetical protein